MSKQRQITDCDFWWHSAKEAVAAMIKRLAHRNANVQLYTLEVGDSLPVRVEAPIPLMLDYSS